MGQTAAAAAAAAATARIDARHSQKSIKLIDKFEQVPIFSSTSINHG